VGSRFSARSAATRRVSTVGRFAVAVSLLTLGFGGPVARAQDAADEEELRVFDADLGPAWIDVSAYPEDQKQAYAHFARKCCKCHTLARPINSTLRGDEWDAYVNRMSRKSGSGISPADVKVILGFLIFDSERRARTANAVDPELLPFLRVNRELSGIGRFPASLKDIRVENGSLRVAVEGDRRLDLSRFFANDDGQKLVKWTRRAPNRGEIVMEEVEPREGEEAGRVDASSDEDLLRAVAEAIGSESEPEERIELILDWLDEMIVREYREGTPETAVVLRERSGDATEFTRAFVEMARAAGVPARSRLGFVARRTAFYLHHWAEVWLDGWVPVDPYLGQLPADLTHIRLDVSEKDALASWDAGSVPGLDRLKLRVVVPDVESGEDEG
jgi:transglutaminase-like putative cysteine protease